MKIKAYTKTEARAYIETAGRCFETKLKLDGRHPNPRAFTDAYEKRYPNAPISILEITEITLTTVKKINYNR